MALYGKGPVPEGIPVKHTIKALAKGVSFAEALHHVQQHDGATATRKSWADGVCIYLVKEPPKENPMGDGGDTFLEVHMVQGHRDRYEAHQVDLFATDWVLGFGIPAEQ